MGNPNPKNQFMPGHPSLGGRPKDPPEKHLLKALTKGELIVLMNKILQATPEQLKDFKGTVLEMWLASGVSKAIHSGDFNRLYFILDQMGLSPKFKLEISQVEKELSVMTTDQLLDVAKQEIKRIEEKRRLKYGNTSRSTDSSFTSGTSPEAPIGNVSEGITTEVSPALPSDREPLLYSGDNEARPDGAE